MDQEYVETLLNDLIKPSSSEDKIHLLTVFVSELAKSDQENKKAISEIKDTLLLTTEAIKSLTKNVELIAEKFDVFEKHITTLSKMSAETAEGSARSAKSIVDILKHLEGSEQIMTGLSNRISMLYDAK